MPPSGPNHRRAGSIARRAPLVIVAVLGALGPGCGASEEPTADPGPSAGCGIAPSERATTAHDATITTGAGDRTYSVVVPPGRDDQAPLPLVLDLHGATMDNDWEDQTSQMAALGTDEGFVTVTPQAPDGLQIWDLDPAGDDVDFVLELLAGLEETLCLDTARVYVTGFSAGGMMALTLGCAHDDRFAAVAAVAGTIELRECGAERAVPLLAFHGTADTAVDFDDGEIPVVIANQSRNQPGTSVPDAVAQWAARNGCTDPPAEEDIADDVLLLRHDCPAGAETELYVVEGGGHTWPGSNASALLVEQAGPTTMSIDATELTWDFFRGQALD
jgi:polyhydroxybutyrate depolymerase